MLVDIVIHGDLLCPWCFLQKKSLEAAMERYQALHPEIEFDVSWKPFLLYPTLRRGDKRTLYEKIMSPEKLRIFTSRLQKAGARHGVSFSVTGVTGPSQPGHRLLALALSTRGAAAQAALLDALFRGHFEAGADIADEEWLVRAARSAAGLDDVAVRAVLRSEEAERMLEDEVRSAAVGGVEAVPCVTVQGRFRVGGYQESDVFEGLFDKIRREGR
ncbi:thioredoxin-like protein [Fusarium solani]|uniref:Thioredoxin-like protein n=2 Tax=Fusarium solani TaxID=169388 RepID=A0A9P9RA00_FUSSL|nr:thioredoxin-like protein [Fusarium solani]KAH7271312.1 thioredoxin-like protein [Fusarium solani]